ncbi:tyrosine-type recombinase/integrase [Streptomyces sp. NPDC058175]|uniref:tyrosine-type recombinase/integrase n=1 Tax=Streptomyces sp. NPDC058175 TaxID=3346367 RepID=UPI0036F0B5E2
MPRQVADVLDAHRGRQKAECRAAGKLWNPDGLLFPTTEGERRTALNVRRSFRLLLKAAGFETPNDWTPRELRTSFVSLLSDHGLPIESIARVVGHSTSSTTEKVYRKQLRPVISEGRR